MVERVMEPELMEDKEQTLAYANADFSFTNELFINFIITDRHGKIDKVLDIGCGPGDISIELGKRINGIEITAVDGSKEMIALANQKIKAENLTNKIFPRVGILPNLNVDKGKYDVIIAKDILHHIHEPLNFWEELERLANENTVTYVMDLIRPDSLEKARKIVESATAIESKILKKDFYNSLLAAFTIDEVREQLKKINFNFNINKLGDRHFIVKCTKKINN